MFCKLLILIILGFKIVYTRKLVSTLKITYVLLVTKQMFFGIKIFNRLKKNVLFRI